MKVASLKEIKTELNSLHPNRVLELCMHLIKYKKENKELLSYLLFEAYDEPFFIKETKQEIDILFADVNKHNMYLAKKTVRKILRITNKYIKYSGSKQTEVELLLYFCIKFRKSGIPCHSNTVLGNMYVRQVAKINKALSTLHDDLQFDYAEKLKLL